MNFKIEIKVKKRDELNRKKNTNDNQQNVFQQALAGYDYRWNTKSDNNNNGLVGKICKVPMQKCTDFSKEIKKKIIVFLKNNEKGEKNTHI